MNESTTVSSVGVCSLILTLGAVVAFKATVTLTRPGREVAPSSRYKTHGDSAVEKKLNKKRNGQTTKQRIRSVHTASHNTHTHTAAQRRLWGDFTLTLPPPTVQDLDFCFFHFGVWDE